LAERLPGVPVHSVEVDARSHGYAQAALRRYANARLHLGDSRALLERVTATSDHATQRGFFYLDAHWLEDLPLAQEVAIILARSTDPVIVIDDFAVPGDPGYGFDDYGPGSRLDETFVKSSLDRYEATILYPSAPSEHETGARRGCCVIAKNGATVAKLTALPHLRRGS
jgi:hypothetical protein